uniref:Bm1382 n=1 Tax=Brugia malayi TaxID=6279 RepID=A0A0J9Y7Q9_BRUMA|nr:Bm1382 [Brugia malayi]
MSKFSYRLASYCGRDLSGARDKLLVEALKTQKSQPENLIKIVKGV